MPNKIVNQLTYPAHGIEMHEADFHRHRSD